MTETKVEGSQDIKMFGAWRISRGSERKDKTRPWVATKGPVALVENTWPLLKERIQERVN